jgi:FMN phosphatase YigB (HAD superfamily)
VFDDSDILNEWMRGKFSLEYLAEFRVKVSPDFLVKSFLKDIKYYEPDYQLLTSLANLFPNSRKVLVTDNLPLFNYILKEYKDLNSYFYKIYQSHEVGVLKNDQPNSLFDFIQMDLNLCSFQNSLLIDDNHLNCENFKTKGGKTILIG